MMIKKIILCLSIILLVVATDASAYSKTKISPFKNREQARTRTFSYNSEVASKEGSLAQSQYIRPLSNQWAVSETGDTKKLSQNFTIPFAWIDREIFVYVEGTHGPYEVYVNDKMIGSSEHGSTPFEFDITKHAKEGANTITLVTRTDILSNDNRVGLDGNVIIHAQPRIRIEDFTVKTTFNKDDDGASVELGVKIKSHLLNRKEVRLYYKLLSDSGQEVTNGREDFEIDMRRDEFIRFLIPVPEAEPWTDEAPKLYTILLKLQHEGRYTEYVAYKFGMRNIDMRDGVLYINGYQLPLDHGIEYRSADTKEQTETGLREIKRNGGRLIKVMDGPQPEYFYTICDEIGLYVCDQAKINTHKYGESIAQPNANPSNNPEYEELFKDRAISMYRTSQHHPSVIMFSIAESSPNGYNLYESYLALKTIEPNRPIVFLAADGEWNTDAVDNDTKVKYLSSVGNRMIFNYGDIKSLSPNPNAEVSPTITSTEDGKYRIKNRSHTTTLRAEVYYTVRQGLKKVSEGKLPVRVEPQSEIEVTIPKGEAKPNSKLKYEVSLRSNLD